MPLDNEEELSHHIKDIALSMTNVEDATAFVNAAFRASYGPDSDEMDGRELLWIALDLDTEGNSRLLQIVVPACFGGMVGGAVESTVLAAKTEDDAHKVAALGVRLIKAGGSIEEVLGGIPDEDEGIIWNTVFQRCLQDVKLKEFITMAFNFTYESSREGILKRAVDLGCYKLDTVRSAIKARRGFPAAQKAALDSFIAPPPPKKKRKVGA